MPLRNSGNILVHELNIRGWELNDGNGCFGNPAKRVTPEPGRAREGLGEGDTLELGVQDDVGAH